MPVLFLVGLRRFFGRASINIKLQYRAKYQFYTTRFG
jgi:hypothetical protein